MDAYVWLMDRYRTGDKICLFGFSRGAYTARCLAGMLHVVRHILLPKYNHVDDFHFQVGLLPEGNYQQVQFAYQWYKNTSNNGVRRAQEFRRIHCRDAPVEFLGVWYVCGSYSESLNELTVWKTQGQRHFGWTCRQDVAIYLAQRHHQDIPPGSCS